MVTDSLVRKKFVHDTLKEGINKIHTAWRLSVGAFQVRTGRLRRFADHPVPLTQITIDQYSILHYIPLHLRFLDIRYRKKKGVRASGQHNLYNKIVWPILYKETFPDLRAGFNDEVRREIREQLEKSLNPKSK